MQAQKTTLKEDQVVESIKKTLVANVQASSSETIKKQIKTLCAILPTWIVVQSLASLSVVRCNFQS